MIFKLVWKGQESEVDVPDGSISDVLFHRAQSISGLKATRIRIVYYTKNKAVPLQQHQRLDELKTDKLTIKDLGPQFNYRGVFFLEYFGPFIICPIFRFAFHTQPTTYLTVTTSLWIFHYSKRLLETFFVHTFSHATMPLFNLFKNCAYYWGFAAAIVFSIIRKSGNEVLIPALQPIGLVLFFVFELTNAYCHLKLKNLRPKGSTAHVLPRGFLFNSIACPNYTFEILSWVAFTMYSQVLASALFTFVGAAQMFAWADKKRKRLIEEFSEAKSRGRITPFKFL